MAKNQKTFKYIIAILTVVVLFGTCGMVIYITVSQRNLSSTVDKISEESPTSGLLGSIAGKDRVNILLNEDADVKECGGNDMKHSFHDIDYALLGYNILKGYPDSPGHDPGFTFPIFKADYSSNSQSADCRYLVPDGLVVIPDISCVTSFSSTILQTTYELENYLSTSVRIEGGNFFQKFSASFGYKRFSSTLSNGELVYIMSHANCRYYFAKLDQQKLPPFSPRFIDWVRKLEKTCSEETYFEFIDHFGTHYTTEVIFGAKYLFKNEMKSSSYETLKKEEFNVAIAASFSGIYWSASSSFKLDTYQQQKVSKFQQEVTTSTITVGAPPPKDGSAMEWASVVKDSPVPITYQLSFIWELFSERHMSHLSVNYNKIRNTLEYYAHKYCRHLQDKGDVDNCDILYSGIDLSSTRLHGHTRFVSSVSHSKCLSECLNHAACEAISYCVECEHGDADYQSCYMFTERDNSSAWSSYNSKWVTFVFTKKISSGIKFSNTAVVGISRDSSLGRANSLEDCRNRCLKSLCIAYTYCDCSHKIQNCFLYGDDRVLRLEGNDGYTTIIISESDMLSSDTLQC